MLARRSWCGLRALARQFDAHAPRLVSNSIETSDELKAQVFLSLIRKRGHLVAYLDPLRRGNGGPWKGFGEHQNGSSFEPLLSKLITEYQLYWTPEEKSRWLTQNLRLQEPCHAGRQFQQVPESAFALSVTAQATSAPLHELVDSLVQSHCKYLSFEYDHLECWEQQEWMRQAAQDCAAPLPDSQRWSIFKHLVQAEMFERFLATKFPASKRFGLEGTESIIPALHHFCQESARRGVVQLQIGMAHRGRLNVLHNLLGKPFGEVCAEMEGHQSSFRVGDVKYHLGHTVERQLCSGDDMKISVAPNPSHLEMIHPVVQGLVRSLQRHSGWSTASTMALLIHGDASMSGLGIVPETLQLSRLAGYSIGGSVHIVINNQIGFTTLPAEGRSSLHSTDCAKAAGLPVIHAFADCPDSVVAAMLTAARWRWRFRSDIVVDVCGYRRNGHNEQDDPDITLPLTQRLIQQQPSVVSTYAERLIRDEVVSAAELDGWEAKIKSRYENEYQLAKKGAYKEKAMEFLKSSWQAAALKSLADRAPQETRGADLVQYRTGLPLRTLQEVARGLTHIPAEVTPHENIKKLLARRREMVKCTDSRVDFSFAEMLAFSTLSLRREPEDQSAEAVEERIAQGLNYSHFGVRLSGQDSERGTFNQRHAVIHDVNSGSRYTNISHVHPTQDQIEIYNSPLSEAAVLAFEYGHSVASKDSALVLWEAQFGDFANNAQVIIDQFVTSGHDKWGQESGLVMLLPHGYDGQGPDHSSARLERFLDLTSDDPDHLPGYSPTHRALIQDTFDGIAREFGTKHLQKDHIERIMQKLGYLDVQESTTEVMNVLWAEMGGQMGGELDASKWEKFMVQFIRRQAERDANMFVIVPSTPAQYFHALRRQANLPYKRPLICMTPKFLHHHRPATSALQDMTTGTFFNRLIDDSKGSDNTRHLAHDKAGRPFLQPPAEIERVILCTGQIYYHLSRARRARRISNIVLVRLEQIAPFPHDMVLRVLRQYPNAELTWCQEEPKNQGAWGYVRPRLRTALTQEKARDVFVHLEPLKQDRVTYIGRPVSPTTATAAYWIHAQEQDEIINDALAPGRPRPD